ncbi:zinc finger, CCHC-type containing protein [Tanacetum coccineum]
MVAAAMKHMASSFAKLEKFEGVDFRRWRTKMHFMLSSMSMVYVLTAPKPKDGGENPTAEQVRKRAKWDNDDYVCRGLILNELWDTLEAKYMAEDASSKKFLVSNFTNYKMTDLRPVLEQYNELLRILGRFTQHNMNMDESIKTLEKGMQRLGNVGNRVHRFTSTKGSDERENESPKSTALVHGRGCVDLRLNIIVDNIGSAFMSTSKLNDSILWHARLGHVQFKRMQDMSKDGLIFTFDMDSENDLCDLHATPLLGNKKYFVTFIDDASRFFYVYLLHSKDEALDKFKVFKTEVELLQGSLIKRFRTDRGGEYMDTLKNRVLKEMVNSMLSYSGLSQGFWREAMLTACYLLNRVPNKRHKVTPYELWTKKKPNLNYLRVWSCRAVVRLHDPKLKTLGERGIECIFVGYAEHSKAYRFYVIEPNDFVAINSIIKSRDTIFNEHIFSSVLRPSQRSQVKGTEDSGGSVVSEKTSDVIVQQSEPRPRKSKRHRTPKDFGPEF